MSAAMSGGLGRDKRWLALTLRFNLPSQGSPIKAILCPEPFDRSVPDLAGQLDDDEIARFIFSRFCPDVVLRSAAGPVS